MESTILDFKNEQVSTLKLQILEKDEQINACEQKISDLKKMYKELTISIDNNDAMGVGLYLSKLENILKD